MRECPFCAHGELDVIVVKVEPRALAVHCPECGATGPSSHSPEPEHAIFAWNQRMGRMSAAIK